MRNNYLSEFPIVVLLFALLSSADFYSHVPMTNVGIPDVEIISCTHGGIVVIRYFVRLSTLILIIYYTHVCWCFTGVYFMYCVAISITLNLLIQ